MMCHNSCSRTGKMASLDLVGHTWRPSRAWSLACKCQKSDPTAHEMDAFGYVMDAVALYRTGSRRLRLLFTGCEPCDPERRS